MAILKNTIIFLLPLILTGCYTDFDPKFDTKPVLCLNSLIKAGEPIKINISHTWVYTDVKGKEDHSVKDAEIKILANGQQVDTTYIAKEGDRIRIEANSLLYGSAEAEVTVPYATPADDIDYDITLRSIYADYTPGWGVTGRMLFDINAAIDVPTSRNKDRYYRLDYKSFSTLTDDPAYTDPDEWGNPEYDYPQYPYNPPQCFSKGYFSTPDPIFSEYISDFEDMMGYGSLYDTAFFSDKRFEGASRKIIFGFNGCGFSVTGWDPDSDIMECGYIVTLNTISKSYFDWAMYFWNSESGLIGEFANMGLADPIRGYSNVSTGAGVVAAQSSVTVRINIKDLLQKILDEENPDS